MNFELRIFYVYLMYCFSNACNNTQIRVIGEETIMTIKRCIFKDKAHFSYLAPDKQTSEEKNEEHESARRKRVRAWL